MAEVIRRDRAGVALWKIRGALPFNRLVVSWHPVRFSSVYDSYESAWGKGLGLTLLVLRLCARGGLVFHGTAARIGGRGALFLGISGVGKSTLARLLDSAGESVLTDERPVLRQVGAGFHVYGSPWPSSAEFARNDGAALAKIYFIEHGKEDRITPIPASEAMRRLIQVTTIPWQEPALLDPCLATVDSLLAAIPCAVLAFRPAAEVVEALRRDLLQPEGGVVA